MRIEVNQLPPAAASPNARVHWTKKYRDNRVYAKAVYSEAVQARNSLPAGTQFSPFSHPVLQLTFVFAQKRRRDGDNLLAAAKAGIDAIVDAGLLVDDSVEHVTILPAKIEVDLTRAPLTIIEITEMGENDV